MSHPLTRSTDRKSTSSDDNTIKGSHRARPKGKANENANDSSKPLTSTRSKRLFTEQTNSIDSGDELSTKRHKQRQISLKHTLNNLDKPFVKTSKEGPQAQPSVPDLPCVASCAGSESDDADDEEDAHAHDDIPSAKLPDVDLAPLGPKEIPSLTKIPLSDDDLFGASDSTLTSVSDDSEDDVEPQKATEAPKDASTMSLRSRRSSRSSPSKVVVPELPLPLPLVAPVKRGPGRPRKDGSAPQPRIRPPPSTYTRTRRTPLPKTEQEDLTIPAVDSQPSDQSLMSRTLRSRAQSENISEDDTEDSLAIQKMLLTLPKKSSSDATASDPEVKATRSSFKPPKEHVFLKPQIPLRRGSNGSARSVPYVRSPPRPSHRPPTPSTVPVPFKTKLFHATPSLPPAKFKMPSPSPPSIGQISSQLRLALQQGLRKVLDTNTTTASEPTEDITSTPTREQVEEARHLERKALIAEAYLVLEQTLNSPQSCAELNKLLTGDLLHAMGGLEPLAFPKPEDDKDRLECQHCQRTYKNRRGLSSHIRRCTARQPSDGEATASETEDQRKAKCLSTKDHSEEEEGVIKCVCGSKEDEGDFVQCDDCKAWLHLECVGLSVDKVPDEYYCPPCQQPSMSMTGGKSSRRVYRATNNASNDFDDSDASDNSSSTSPLWKYRAEMEARKQRHEARYEDGPSEATSPQVVLNHDWVEEPSGELGFGGEYMSAQLAAAARSIFKEPCSLALMLDGSSSQEVASSPVPDPLHSSPAIYDDHVFHAYDDGPTAGLELAFGADSPFETVQPIKYFSETNDLLPPHFMELDSSGSFDQLLSDDTIDSDGLRTPLDLHYDSHLASMWEMETMDAPSGKTPLEIDLEVEQTLQAQEDWLYN
ncbi:PHD finger protein 20 [Podila verticillata]|nr:PHD finger protein 20 [Podila verticillata]